MPLDLRLKSACGDIQPVVTAYRRSQGVAAKRPGDHNPEFRRFSATNLELQRGDNQRISVKMD